MEFTGTWDIYEMSNWDEEYYNMEVQAYIEIDEQGNGEFQFGFSKTPAFSSLWFS